MPEELLVSVLPWEVRVALLEDGVLQEIYFERSGERSIVGNIYKGKVTRILPGMQAAFVEIGRGRSAFLHVSDMWQVFNQEETQNNRQLPEIRTLLMAGQEVLVQVIKEPFGTKGARLSTQITLPSRFLVFMPNHAQIGISKKISDDIERERLLAIVKQNMSEPGGFVVRTAASGVDEALVSADRQFLERLWRDIKQRVKRIKQGLVYEEIPLVHRCLRNLVTDNTTKIRVDQEALFQQLQTFAQQFVPMARGKIELYQSNSRSLLDLYGVEEEIQKALLRRVPLKSGGYLVIDQTEAMTTIDVNTGGFVGRRNLEETLFKTNLEATQTIARQLRLRNLGGIIIVDFIDMTTEEHKQQVWQAFNLALAKDHARITIGKFSEFGLVEMTRERTRESLGHVLCEPCATCHGRGEIKTAAVVSYEIFREILRDEKSFSAKGYLVLAAQTVIDRLIDEESSYLAELETGVGKPIKLQVAIDYAQDQYDVVLL